MTQHQENNLHLGTIAVAAAYFGVTVLISSAAAWIKYPAGIALCLLAVVCLASIVPERGAGMSAIGLDLATAYAHAVQKWEYIRDNGGDGFHLSDDLPHLRSYRYYCSYCQMFLNMSAIDVGEDPCAGCPLNVLPYNGDVGCSREGHPHLEWFLNQSTETSQAVLDLIIKTKPI